MSGQKIDNLWIFHLRIYRQGLENELRRIELIISLSRSFAIVFTINMEIGLITPPVGLNLYIIKGITPDVSLSEILKGSIPFMIIMALAILILCIFPEIVTWLPDKIMGKPLGY